MIDQNFIYLGVLISFIGVITYVIDTLKGHSQPHKVTFFLWTLAPFIAFFAQLKEGVGLQSATTFMVGFIPFLIFLASFKNKKSDWKIEKFDLICGLFSLLALIFWYITKSGNVAIFFAIISDFLAGVPTILKSYHHPESETSWAYLAGIISALLTVLTLTQWTFANSSFPLYIILMNTLLFSLIKFKLGKS